MFNTSKKSAQISGIIESIENHPYKDDEILRIILDKVKIEDEFYSAKLRLNVSADQAKYWSIGDSISLEASIYPIPMPSSLH